jgi:heat shock protein HslJ
VVSCNTTKKQVQTNKNDPAKELITQQKWRLVKLEGQEMPESKTPAYFTLHPEDKKINGFAGCNNFMGEYTLETGNRIRFSKIASTRMACPDMEIDEREILNVYEIADNYTITGDTLILNVGRRAPLAVFQKETPQVIEKYWKLVKLEGKLVKMQENQEKEFYFILKTENNRLTGFAGCNSFSGNYSLEKENRIQFSKIASSMKACPDVEVNESEFLKVFELADNYTVDGEVLSLNVGRRAPLAVFEAVCFE